jgi:arsenate reductase
VLRLMSSEKRLPRLLILCTGNSARSQMAEALISAKAHGRFAVFSAGSHPAAQVHPQAVEALRLAGIPWAGHAPKHFDDLERGAWDYVITVCDNANESCPVVPGEAVRAHWGMPDPAAATGTDAQKLVTFIQSRDELSLRIDRMLALPLETLDYGTARDSLNAIGLAGAQY